MCLLIMIKWLLVYFYTALQIAVWFHKQKQSVNN